MTLVVLKLISRYQKAFCSYNINDQKIKIEDEIIFCDESYGDGSPRFEKNMAETTIFERLPNEARDILLRCTMSRGTN